MSVTAYWNRDFMKMTKITAVSYFVKNADVFAVFLQYDLLNVTMALGYLKPNSRHDFF